LATTATTVDPRPVPTVVRRITERDLPPYPLAVAAGDVWVAHRGEGEVTLERRDAHTGKLVDSVTVAQEAAFAVAAEGDMLYVAGGGDGGVPETSVSALDARTGKLKYTHTLTGTPCSCELAAGAGALWLGANGSDVVLRVDRDNGHLVTTVRLPRVAQSIAVVADRVVAGLDNGSIIVIDPSTNQVSGPYPAHINAHDATAPITAVIPVRDERARGNSWIAAANGEQYLFMFDDSFSGFEQTSFIPAAGVDAASGLWLVGGRRLARMGQLEDETYVEQPDGSFARAADGLQFDGHTPGFDQVVAVGDVLWINEFGAGVVAVRLPAGE
jgi:outer membrane protein assembly factor BamB